jgi:large subunit ribosomal protein L21
MRYAIVASGGKQYVAREGEALEVDRLAMPAGDDYEFPEVLLAADGDQILVGAPVVDGASVRAKVVGEVKGEKVVVFRYQPKKRRRRKLGHRQTYSRLVVETIDLPGVPRRSDEGAPAPKKPAAPRRKTGGAKKASATKKPGASKKSSPGTKTRKKGA